MRLSAQYPWHALYGTVWLDPGKISESYIGQDIIFYTETHQSFEGTLPIVSGYTQELAYHEETREVGGARGSGGFVVLFRPALISMISMV